MSLGNPAATLGDLSARFAANHALPIWFGDRPDLNEAACIRTATASLVEFAGRFLAITCDHVLRGFEEFRRQCPTAVFGLSSFTLDPEVATRERSSTLDLAIIDISAEVRAGLVDKLRFHSPPTWPPRVPVQGDFVAFAGFPGAWLEQPGVAHLRFNSFASGGSEVHSVAEKHFYARLELEKCEIGLDTGRRVESLGGLSGDQSSCGAPSMPNLLASSSSTKKLGTFSSFGNQPFLGKAENCFYCKKQLTIRASGC
jgi:hypothetical protein